MTVLTGPDHRCYFQHWRWEVPEDVLKRLPSPHLSRAEAGKEAVKILRSPSGAELVTGSELDLQLPQLALLAGNEAYAETAIADPLADLLLWHDWESNERKFPYPGIYAPLEIDAKTGKTESTAAIGCLGEGLVGIFAQAGIGVSPAVRVTRRWPDLIFQEDEDTHFCEAKGTLEAAEPGAPVTKCGKQRLALQDCALAALHHLAADPWVTVWSGFVQIELLEGHAFRFSVTFLEMRAPAGRKSSSTREVPDVVLNAIAERALAQALNEVDPQGRSWRVTRKRRVPKVPDLSRLELQQVAQTQVHRIIEAEFPALERYLEGVTSRVSELGSRVEVAPGTDFGRMRRIKSRHDGRPIRVRDIGDTTLVTESIKENLMAKIRGWWKPDWSQVTRTYNRKLFQGYRAGGNYYGLMPREQAQEHAAFE